jgi:hypothetical protein
MNLQELNIKKLTILWECCDANVSLRQKLEKEFLARKGNKKYSFEYLYSINKVGNRPLTFYFIPQTISFNTYGKVIVVDLILDEFELATIHRTYVSKPPVRTFGILKAKCWDIGMKKEQHIELSKTGFNTSDIGLVEYEL